MIPADHLALPSTIIRPNLATSRAGLMRQRACIVWLTGLSGAGKSTLANLVETRLAAEDRHAYILDGDNLRSGLNRDLGFSDADRIENMRRTVEVARLMADAGLIVIVSLISPFRRERAQARKAAGAVPFIEVHVDAPLAECERRDPKGLYRRARRGEIAHFTGIDSPYEAPDAPDLRLDTSVLTPEQAAERLIGYLQEHVLGRSYSSLKP
ncbi:adenylyl-sulfate kinase [Methylobacterium nodulans]|uniref:Adenylyl-sulfate kinase n=2 Tax=Methylobacterium nodulans TaxID=114616 RepID=B8ITJ8_METNO|nr:adenylyl-sulfate kinase [Methylobacterium nodulans]ACL58914.1 adenylylsulfate kinase [Methylobacterium nodulans ORS 2060]CAN84688.1 putative NodQ protein [Methylobacterium nodulans ORS 2060]